CPGQINFGGAGSDRAGETGSLRRNVVHINIVIPAIVASILEARPAAYATVLKGSAARLADGEVMETPVAGHTADGVRPGRRCGGSGDVAIIGICIAQTETPLVLHGSPIRNRPLAVRCTVGGNGCIISIEGSAVGRIADAIDIADNDLWIPGILLVTQP